MISASGFLREDFIVCFLHMSSIFIHIAALRAPQALPLKPIPPASPATITASSLLPPIFFTTSEAQLLHWFGKSLCPFDNPSCAAWIASGAHLSARLKHDKNLPEKKYFATLSLLEKSVSVISPQSALPPRFTNDFIIC